MSASTKRIVKWAAAGCGIALIAIIGFLACFNWHKSHRKDKTVATKTAKCQNGQGRRGASKAKSSAPATAKETTVYGQDVYPTSLSYTIKATVKSQGVPAPESAIKCGIENSSICHPKTQMIENKNVITDGRGQTVQFSVNLLDNAAGFFRPAFKVTAGVALENIEVVESPPANGEPELTIVEGTILERSAIPDPEKSDYHDCRFTCHFKGNSIIKGKPCPQEMSLILEGFADRKLLGTKDLKPGDRVICIVLPFNKLPQEKQTTQQADDLNLFALESYYAIDVRKIDEFSDLPGAPSSGIAFTDASDKPYVSVFERHVNPPIKEEFRKAQQEAIAQELQKIEAMLAPYTPEKIAELRQKFTQAWEAEKAKDPPNYNRVVRGKTEYVWRNVENSFWALPTNYRLPEYQENPIAPYNLEALIALRDFLEANGCQFLVSPVPPAYEIAARVINPEFRTLPDFQTAYMARQLLKHGIETLYPSKTLIDNFHRYPWAFFFPHNAHPSDTTQDVMTDIVSAKLQRYLFPELLDSNLFSVKSVPHAYGSAQEYCFPRNCDSGARAPGSSYQCRQIWYQTAPLNPNDGKESPILAIGNSFMQTPMHRPESFPTLLTSKINIPVQRYRIARHGPMTAIVQQLFASPETRLSRKTVVILVVGTYHLCAHVTFNNIREMDGFAKCMSGKKLIDVYDVKANIDANDKQILTSFRTKQIPRPNFFEISMDAPITLMDMAIANIDSHKPTTIVIPTALDVRKSAKYFVNGQEVVISGSYATYPHLNASCELPAGTDRLKVELVGKPGTILSIRNIQVYQ